MNNLVSEIGDGADNVSQDIFVNLDKMIFDYQMNSKKSPKNESTNILTKDTTTPSLEARIVSVSFRQMKKAIHRAEQCGHSTQNLNVFDASTVFFQCSNCDKKTFVDSKDWEVDTTITEISNITEISIDDDEEDGELLLKEDTQGKNISKSDKEIVLKEQEQLKSSNINDKMKKSWKCRVMFSGYRSKDHMSIILGLGGRLTSNIDGCNVIVTDKLRMTPRILMSLGRSIPIVSPAWILECKEQKAFLDPWNYLLHDQLAEKIFNFALKNILLGQNMKILQGVNVFISPNNTNSNFQLKDVIAHHGGEVITEHVDNTDIAVVESSEKNIREVFKVSTKTYLVDRKGFLSYLLMRKK